MEKDNHHRLMEIIMESSAHEIYPTGIEVDGGNVNFYIDAEKIASTTEGRNLLKEAYKQKTLEEMKESEKPLEFLVVPEDFLIRAPSMNSICREIAKELNISYKVIPIENYVVPALINNFKQKLSSSDLENISKNRMTFARMTIEPGEVQPPHRHNTFIELVEILGGRFRKNGKFYGFGHKFMLNKSEVHSYDNIGFDRPLEIFAICIPRYDSNDVEYV